MHRFLSKSTRKWLYPILILLGIVIIVGCIGKNMMTTFREELENKRPRPDLPPLKPDLPHKNNDTDDEEKYIEKYIKKIKLPFNPFAEPDYPITNRERELPNPMPERMGNDNAYILKSSIVPPVCPKCPDLISTNKEKKCPPCPPCARCPEPKYKCESVYNPLASANDLSIVRPNITPQI